MRRRLPDCELAPNSVPCGPESTSMRSMSAAYTSKLRPPNDTGCSSTYNATPGDDPWAVERVTLVCSVALPRM